MNLKNTLLEEQGLSGTKTFSKGRIPATPSFPLSLGPALEPQAQASLAVGGLPRRVQNLLELRLPADQAQKAERRRCLVEPMKALRKVHQF